MRVSGFQLTYAAIRRGHKRTLVQRTEHYEIRWRFFGRVIGWVIEPVVTWHARKELRLIKELIEGIQPSHVVLKSP